MRNYTLLFALLFTCLFGYSQQQTIDLFNGKNLDGWVNHGSEKWYVENGLLICESGPKAEYGYLSTAKNYKNFELTLEFKQESDGNSGVFILADELENKIYFKAVEVQILDNERHSDNKIASHLSGSIYDLVASPKSSHKEAGQWNQLHIKLVDKQLTVWQNGIQAVDIDLNGQAWQTLIEQSKFKTWKGFGKAKIGHIGLQDHSDPVWFKNIKIKEL